MGRLLLTVSALLTLAQLSAGTLSSINVSAGGCQPATSPLCRLKQVKQRQHAALLNGFPPSRSGSGSSDSSSPASGEPMAVIIPKERAPPAATTTTTGGRQAAVLVPSAPMGSAGPSAPLRSGGGGSQSQADAGVQQITNSTSQTTQVGAQVTTTRNTTEDRRGVSVSGGLALAGNLQVATPFGTFQVSDANAHTVNKNKRLPLLEAVRRRKQ